ncbi:hypothetical protein HHI36_006180 [Cryptolaemus montrouzieri]|uniref:Uncharacterized protein n=1 Tax=Cryptolaemus montrouzieri TaxID=559131 RepID=A0ABD2NWH9_9CUCU
MFHGKIAIAMLFHVMMQCEGALIPLKDREGKVSLLEWTNYNYREPEGQGTYAFGYDIEDPDTNNIQFRNEEKLSNGSVVGSYGYLQPTGDAFVVKYIADEGGYSLEEDSNFGQKMPNGTTQTNEQIFNQLEAYQYGQKVLVALQEMPSIPGGVEGSKEENRPLSIRRAQEKDSHGELEPPGQAQQAPLNMIPQKSWRKQ